MESRNRILLFVTMLCAVAILLTTTAGAAPVRKQTQGTMEGHPVCIGWGWYWYCVWWYRITLTESETNVLKGALAMGVGLAAALIIAFPPSAPLAAAIAAGLTLTSGFITLVDSFCGNHGIYFTGYIPGPSSMWCHY